MREWTVRMKMEKGNSDVTTDSNVKKKNNIVTTCGESSKEEKEVANPTKLTHSEATAWLFGGLRIGYLQNQDELVSVQQPLPMFPAIDAVFQRGNLAVSTLIASMDELTATLETLKETPKEVVVVTNHLSDFEKKIDKFDHQAERIIKLLESLPPHDPKLPASGEIC